MEIRAYLIEVRAGAYPGVELDNYTRVWSVPNNTDAETFVHASQAAFKAALDYAAALQPVIMARWVEVKWVWVEP